MNAISILLLSILLINNIANKNARYVLVKLDNAQRTGKLFHLIDNGTYHCLCITFRNVINVNHRTGNVCTESP